MQTLITRLCRDETIDKQTKQTMLSNWEQEIINAGANRIMDKCMAEKHYSWLEMISNAKRIVGT